MKSHYNFRWILLLIIGLTVSIQNKSQDLTIDQTIQYLNSRFSEFPYQVDYFKYDYSFSLTDIGELKIELRKYFKNPFKPGEIDLSTIETFKIRPDAIDLNNSFLLNHYNELKDEIYIYPNEKGYFAQEKIDEKGVQEFKRTVPFEHGMTLDGYFKSKNFISISLGDAGKKQNIKNALLHLCTLIISEPLKYANRETSDPFEKRPLKNYQNSFSDTLSNTIKIEPSEGGLIEVPVTINDVLRIDFIFDSGASEVSISPDVALTLMRTGTILESDWLPSQSYIFADGSKAESERFLIRKLMIGNQTLSNIEASISKSIEAPMLIGQNVMRKLGALTIDYNNKLLIIKK